MELLAKVHGRVQGVCYRAWTLELAQQLSLTGWVRNCDDGSVELLAVGERETLENFLAQCYRGPGGAKVTSIDVKWKEASAPHHDFSIIR